jgi:catechol 2,3-dioxygenase-like lactoylglutathione lyase family enzyme
MPVMEIREVHLEAPAGCMEELGSFYANLLGLVKVAGGDTAVAVGTSRLCWQAADGAREPFYHFALLVPGHRFGAAREWLSKRVDLLPHNGEPVVTFEAWNALAVYFHDPAGSIVELIAHLDIEGTGPRTGSFHGSELLGVSEIGLVLQDKRAAATALQKQVGVAVWPATSDLALDDPDDLAFVGRKAHTLILAPPGRGWLPTARPAEAHPVAVVLAGTGSSGCVSLPGEVVVRTG